jgi:hypothetical protein
LRSKIKLSFLSVRFMQTNKHNEFLDLPYARRQWMARAAAGLLGVHCLPTFEQKASAASPNASAKQVIMLTMRGAMSHIDTFDPKPGRESQGETKAIHSLADDRDGGPRTRNVFPTYWLQEDQQHSASSDGFLVIERHGKD